MKKILLSIAVLCIANLSISQVVFQSDLSSWASGVPTDFFGTKTNLDSANCTEVMTGAMHGTSIANLVNTGSGHKRFTTKGVNVVSGERYVVQMWMAGTAGDFRVATVDTSSNSYSYSSYQSLSGTMPVILRDTITIGSSTTQVEFIISFRNTTALGAALDSVSISRLMGPPPPVPSFSTRTIYEIQYTTDASGDSPFEDSLVETTGIVTASYSGGYWIQDSAAAWNGIYVFDNSNSPARGDNVTIKGLVAEYFGLTQIKNIDTLITNSTGNVLPAKLSLNSMTMKNEMYEGVLARASNAKCTDPAAGFGEWTFSNVPGDTARVDDIMYLFSPVLGTRYDITGVVYYSFSNFKLQPRDSLDVVASTITSIDEKGLEFSLYPNPVNTVLTLSGFALETAEIFSINGKLIKSISLNTINNIDVADLENGAYILRVSGDNKIGVTRFIKQ
ncbi:MAG: T9SS type A sorting domain-containing protein [Flavobacteriales bacterium]